MNLPIASIQVNTPTRYDLGTIQSLAENIAEFGLLHPILVTEAGTRDKVQGTTIKSQTPINRGKSQISTRSTSPNVQTEPESANITNVTSAGKNPQSALHNPQSEIPSSLRFALVAGYRRLKAAELLGWTEVPVSIISPTDDLKQFDISLHENFRRKELNPLEVCDAILERKQRWEKIYGPVKRGPKSSEGTSEVEFHTNCEKFTQDTARILRTSESTIHRFLQLKELDEDIKQQLWERKISYATALSLQSQRKRELKQSKRPGMTGPRLPDAAMAASLQAEYDRSPNLFQIIMLISHVYQTMLQNQGKQLEFENANPERLAQLVAQLSAIMSWLTNLMKQTQDTLMKQMEKEELKN